MLDNRLIDPPGKRRYEFIVFDCADNIQTIFRTDDAQSISLVKSFAEEYLVKRTQETSQYYHIEFRDNNELVDKRIRKTYGVWG